MSDRRRRTAVRFSLIGLVAIMLISTLVACEFGKIGLFGKTAPADQPPAGGPFKAEYVPGLTEPEVIIVNEAERLITVILTGRVEKKVELPSGESETLNLPVGRYEYEASAEGVQPKKGRYEFEADHRYTWTFSIAGR